MKLERLITILTLLLQKDIISATWFAEKFGVSVRTIYRDIETLEGAGIPIVTHTGVNGGISIIDSYKIDKKLFTNQDIITLLTSLYSVSGSISDTTLNQTLEKIKTLIPEEHNTKIERKSKQIYIDMTPWASNPNVTDALEKLQSALESNRVISFHYTGRHNHTTRRCVEPHQLALKENKWYLRAYCLERSDFRTFKISRMSEVEILTQSFEPREFQSGMTDFKDWQSEKMITVELILHFSLRERILDYCKEEYIKDIDEENISVSLPFVESELGYGVLLSMGHLCTVLSPISVRNELIRRIELLRGVYKKKEN